MLNTISVLQLFQISVQRFFPHIHLLRELVHTNLTRILDGGKNCNRSQILHLLLLLLLLFFFFLPCGLLQHEEVPLLTKLG